MIFDINKIIDIEKEIENDNTKLTTNKLLYLYNCECCNFNTNDKSKYDKHNLTIKPYNNINNLEQCVF